MVKVFDFLTITSFGKKYWGGVKCLSSNGSKVLLAGYYGTSNPIQISSNKGSKWDNTNSLSASWNYVTASPDGSIICVGGQFNRTSTTLQVSFDTGSTWSTKTITTTPAFSVGISELAGGRWQTSGSVVFVAISQYPAGLGVSKDSGTNWSFVPSATIDSTLPSYAFPESVFITPDGDKCFTSIGTNLYISSDQCSTWSKISSLSPSSGPHRYTKFASSANGNIIYLIGNKQDGTSAVFKSTDHGSTWNTTPILVSAAPDAYNAISTDSTGSVVVVCQAGNSRILFSNDGGSNWIFVPGSNIAITSIAYYSDISLSYDGTFFITSAGDINPGHQDYLFTSTISDIIPPCFLPFTRILTPLGYRRVETLSDYDEVETGDGRSVAVKVFKTHIAKTNQDTAPYVIPRGAIADGVPDEDLHVSGLHAIQDANGMWQFPMGLAMHKDSRVRQHLPGKPATYYHLECPNYFTDNLVANNCVAESFRNRQGREGITFEYCEAQQGFVRNREDEIKDASDIPSDVLAVYS